MCHSDAGAYMTELSEVKPKKHKSKPTRQTEMKENLAAMTEAPHPTTQHTPAAPDPEPHHEAPPQETPVHFANGEGTPAIDTEAEVVAPKKRARSTSPKKRSANDKNWRAQKAFEPEQVITLIVPIEETKKARGSGDRYRLYVDGMTVAQYTEALKVEPFNRQDKQTMDDLRWDYVCNFIKIDGAAFVPPDPPEEPIPPDPLEEPIPPDPLEEPE
jgi:hypothetical protein